MSAYNNDTSPIPQNVQRLETQLIQAPTEANGNRAVCSVTAVLSNGKSFTELADADETNLAETQSSIDMAAAKALSRVMTRIAGSEDPAASPPWDNGDGEDMFSLPSSKPSRKHDGGGTKPISPKQTRCIVNVCQQRGKDADSLARERFGKTVEDLQGAEADMLIKALIGKKND